MIGRTMDIEPTNRCNAWCSFCPRDKTPHQGLMPIEVFDQALARTVEWSDRRVSVGMEPVHQVALCGLGEPLLHRLLPEMISKIRSAGFVAQMASNGALLDERRSHAILDAGLSIAALNVGEIGEAYERVYELPWERTLERVLAFKELSRGRAQVMVVLVNHHERPERLQELRDFWKAHRIPTFLYEKLGNRGGSLPLDHMRFDEFPETEEARQIVDALPDRPLCHAPFLSPIIGYDGQYYLCCQDWEKRVPLGSVFDTDIDALTINQVEAIEARDVVCPTCSHDPVNRIATHLREAAAGSTDETLEDAVNLVTFQWLVAKGNADQLNPGIIDRTLTDIRSRAEAPSKKRIPLTIKS